MNYLTLSVSSFLVTAAVTPVVIRFAKACKCVDVPGGRRGHEKATPRLGGLGFCAGVLPLLLMENGGRGLNAYIMAACLVLGMGIVDDLKSLKWKTKFAAMVAAATILIFGGGVVIHNIGSYGPFVGELGWFGIPFTYISIIGLTSAINLLDGLNGLAGGVSLLGFLFMGIAAALTGNILVAVICFAYVGGLAGFLLYNFPNARVFMGDSGSTILGFTLSFVAASLTQGPSSSVSPMFPLLLLIIPIFDTLRVIWVRLRNGKNPFEADRLHLHYLMQEKISSANVTLVFWLLTIVFGGIALILTGKSSLPYIAAVVGASLFLGLVTAALTQKQQPQRTDRLAPYVLTSMGTSSVGIYSAGSGLARTGGLMIKWFIGLGIMLVAAQVGADETQLVAAPRDKTNYAIGVSVVKNMKQQGTSIDIDSLVQGMRDALSGQKLLLTDEELKKTMLAVQEEVRRKQKVTPIVAAKEGHTFLLENKKKDGVVTLPSGLQYKVIKKGDGKVPTDSNFVVCNYRGTLLNGAEFERSYRPATLSVQEGAGIPGLSEALKLMPVGSKWQLFIPPKLAFGERGRSSVIGSPVGPNETIIVEVELLAINS